MDFNPILFKRFDISLKKNNVLQHRKLKSITLSTTCNSQTKEATTTIYNDPNVNGLSLHIIRYSGEVDIMSLIYSVDPNTVPVRSETDHSEQNSASGSTATSTDEATNTSNDQYTWEFNLPSTSNSAEGNTTSKASTSGMNRNSRKRTFERVSQSQVQRTMQPKVEKLPPITFTITNHFVDHTEPETPAVPQVRENVLIQDALLTAEDTSINDGPNFILNEPSISAANYSVPMYLDDNSNYSSVLTEEDKYDSFYESLTE